MTKSDPAILEVFEEAGIAIPPAVAEYNLMGVSKSTISRRLPVLVDHGLLERVDEDRGYYRITDRGRAYLSGELESDDFQRCEFLLDFCSVQPSGDNTGLKVLNKDVFLMSNCTASISTISIIAALADATICNGTE